MRNWSKIVAEMRGEDVDRMVAASYELDKIATKADLPRLYRLLRDEEFFIREAAAVPVSRLGGLRALPRLLDAWERGGREGHDCDGLTVPIWSVVENDPAASAKVLLKLIESRSQQRRQSAAWLMGFVSEALQPAPLLNALQSKSPSLRSTACGALGSFDKPEHRDAVLTGLMVACSDPDEQVRVSAICALGVIGDSQAEQTLRKARRDSRKRVRYWADESLKRLAQKSK